MRKIQKNILLLCLVGTLFLTLLAGCGTPTVANGQCTLVIANEAGAETVYTVSLDGLHTENGLLAVLDALQIDGRLTYAADNTGFGAYLTAVGGVSQDPARNLYLLIYTSVEADFDVSVYASQVSYGDLCLHSSGVGISQMKVTDGAIYYIKLGSY